MDGATELTKEHKKKRTGQFATYWLRADGNSQVISKLGAV